MSDFIHLHCHTEYSTLDGMPKIEEYILRCNDLEMPGIAITEHGNLRSAYQLQIKSQKRFEFKGKEYDINPVKPIFGIEFYVALSDCTLRGLPQSKKDQIKIQSTNQKEYNKKVKELELDLGLRQRYHLLAFAKNQKGLDNLFRLNYWSWKKGFYYRPRIDLNLLKKYHEGVVITTACIGGWTPELVYAGEYSKAEEWIRDIKKVFGDDLYIEIQPHDMEQQGIVNIKMVQLANTFGVKIVATNDCHYLRKEDWETHDVLLAIQSDKTMAAQDRWRFDTNEFYMKSKKEMLKSFQEYHPLISKVVVKNSLENTMEIFEKCNVEIEIDRKKGILPVYKIPDEYDSENKFLIDLCKKGWTWRRVNKRVRNYCELNGMEYSEGVEIYKCRLKAELLRIFKLKFTKYFLIIWDLMNWARENEIAVGPGRGSSASSLVCFLLGVTSIDPIQYDLLFDRFLSENRIDFPDVDMDFQDNRRKEVFQYLVEKYGEKNVCQIGTVSRMKGKAALLDVGRVLEVPYQETLAVNKHIIQRSGGDARSSQTVQDSFGEFEICKKYHQKYPEVLNHVIKLEDKARQMGIHAAGIQIAPSDISRIVPIEYRTVQNERVKISSWNWIECQGVGLIKLDILGLKTLSVLDTARKA
ncbi:MAG: DNA polymerase III subunit alpha, partial [Candidatus Kariarchaeaceae archaeon]